MCCVLLRWRAVPFDQGLAQFHRRHPAHLRSPHVMRYGPPRYGLVRWRDCLSMVTTDRRTYIGGVLHTQVPSGCKRYAFRLRCRSA